MVLHAQGYGMVRVFPIEARDGVAEHWATNDLGLDIGLRQHYAERGFAIENDHRELKPGCGVEECRARSEVAQRNPVAMAVRAGLWLEWHFFTTGTSGFMARSGIVDEAIRRYLADPLDELPQPSTP
jgi:hypothetical protein